MKKYCSGHEKCVVEHAFHLTLNYHICRTGVDPTTDQNLTLLLLIPNTDTKFHIVKITLLNSVESI